jgi:hypothetical protein
MNYFLREPLRPSPLTVPLGLPPTPGQTTKNTLKEANRSNMSHINDHICTSGKRESTLQLLRVIPVISLLILIFTQPILGQRVADTEEFVWPTAHEIQPSSNLIESKLPAVFMQDAQEEVENKSCGRTILLGMGGGMLGGAALGYVLRDGDSDSKKWTGFGVGILGTVAGLVFGSLSCT